MGHGVYVAVEALASSKKLSFTLELPPALPVARGDDRRLTQVLLNLVGNAIKFTDQGEVAIKASATNGAYTLSVCDTGPGIAPGDQAKIFEEFQQADSSATKKKGGTGLGLSIARRIIELHGGKIWVEAEIGKGAPSPSIFRSRSSNSMLNGSGYDQTHSRGRGSGRQSADPARSSGKCPRRHDRN